MLHRPFGLPAVLVALLALAVVWASTPGPALAQDAASPAPAPDLGIVSTRYIVVDADTGEIYAQRGMHERVPLASLTKIFTAIEAIEEAPDGYQITTTEADLVDWEATQVGFGPGETFTLGDLLYGMMVASGNDAAKAIARALGAQEGDSAGQAVTRFMERINARVRDMGLADTNLVNPDGWGVPNHYSTAYDIAAFTRYALRYPRFVAAISAEEYATSAGGYRLVNTNKMMDRWDDLLGGKTGYDDTAGYCLMQVARQNGATMIAVTLDGVAPDVWYEDNRVLLDYAFAAKAERQAAGLGPLPAVARYLDPDAAVLQRIATAGASVGGVAAPVAPAPTVAPVSDAAPDLVQDRTSDGVPAAAVRDSAANSEVPADAAVAALDTRSGASRRWILAVAVAAFLAFAAARAAWSGTGRTARPGPAG